MDRYIYLLAFGGRQVYIGQSVDPVRRIKAHRRPSGGWINPVELALIAHRIVGSELEIVDLEYAWRWRAHLSGWQPISLDGIPFDMALVRESAKHQADLLPWPFIT
ncbi:MAG: GIY-YIG nuclease family protein [Betaproteobacteria bacterium]|nr:GIY-YIG nuclease family protein [Betaproteobacteria bacterium]